MCTSQSVRYTTDGITAEIYTRYYVSRDARADYCHATSAAALDHQSIEITAGVGVISLTEHTDVYCVLQISLT